MLVSESVKESKEKKNKTNKPGFLITTKVTYEWL